MKANDKAIEALADVLQHHGVFHGWFPKGLPSDWRQLDPIGRREFLDIAGRLADAAYAAQFPPSEDYAGLVTELRMGWATKEKYNRAVDALEAVLAERDALKAELAAANKRAANRLAVEAERDALLARNKRLQETLSYWNDTYKYSPANEQPPILEDAARLAPVDDKELVEIVAKEFIEATTDIPPRTTYTISERSLAGARAAIAAIRPHIEAAERERCARIADKYEGEWHSDTADACARAIAAAIRSRK